MRAYTFQPGPIHLLRLATGDDLYDTVTTFAKDNGIGAAWVTFLGAVSKASLRYYNQDAKEYEDFVIDKHLEVLVGTGNVSTLDGEPFVHIHAAFGDRQGSAHGGHVNSGTKVWALEVTVVELLGETPVREPDDCTGLALWGGTL